MKNVLWGLKPFSTLCVLPVFAIALSACSSGGGNNSPASSDDTSSNTVPRFTSGATVSIAENQSLPAYTAIAEDGEGDALSFSISGGNDAGLFSINAGSGEVQFTTAPDFEAPQDNNADNQYELTISVADTNGASVSLDIVITVENVDDFNVDVIFPLSNANVQGVEQQLTVRGRVNDAEDGAVIAADITSLTINGVVAVLGSDPSQWSADIPLTLLENVLNIEASFANGQTVSVSRTFHHEPLLINPMALVFDASRNQALVLDLGLNALVAVSLADGSQRIVSNAAVGTGREIASATEMVMDAANDRVLIKNNLLGNTDLIAVDLVSGNRAVISDTLEGGVTSVALDAAGNRLLAYQRFAGDMLAIDADTGAVEVLAESLGSNAFENFVVDDVNDRVLGASSNTISSYSADTLDFIEVLSSSAVGTGPSCSNIADIVADTANNRVIILCLSAASVLAVDLDTGNRTLLADTNIAGRSIALDSVNDGVVVLNNLSVASASFASGEQTTVANNVWGAGELFDFSTSNGALAWDIVNQRAFTANRSGRVLTVDLQSGDRTLLSANTGDANTVISDPRSISLSADSSTAYVPDSTLAALLAIDTITGERRVVSNDTHSGPAFISPRQALLDEDNNRAILLDASIAAGRRLLSIDLGSGVRTLLATQDVVELGQGAITFDAANNRVFSGHTSGLFGSNGSVFATDLGSAETSVLSNADVGLGPTINRPYAFVLDADDNLLYMTEVPSLSSNARVISVDLQTGDRNVVAQNEPNIGLPLQLSSSIAIDAANDLVLLSDAVNGMLVLIDLVSGERAVVSRSEIDFRR